MLVTAFLFHTMGAMLVHDDADILLRAPACPLAATIDRYHSCRVHGSVSRSFTTNEVEITLADKSVLWIDPKDLLGYSQPTDSVHYEPFGKYFVLGVGLLILAVGGWLLVGAPTRSKSRHSNQRQTWPF
jgi:hypothetical protein